MKFTFYQIVRKHELKTIYYKFLLVLLTLLLVGNDFYPQTIKGKAYPLPDDLKYLGSNVLMMENSKVVCREMKKEENADYLMKPSINQHYTLVNSLNEPASVRGLKIILRATDQLLENKEALLGFRRAAARWERYIRTKITVVIDVDYGNTRWGEAWGANVLGSTTSALKLVVKQNGEYAKATEIVMALKDKHPSDQQLLNLYNAIPIPTPSTAGTNLGVAVAGLINFQELGILDAEIDPDPNVSPFGDVPAIGFNSTFKFDFDPSDGVDGDAIDFDGTVTHEIGHALGFNSIIGSGGDPDNYFTPWDLFRVRPEAVEPGSLVGFKTAERIVTPGPVPTDIQVIENNVTYYKANHVFFDGLTELELSTATGNRTGGDGQQASHWRDDALRPPSLGDKRWIGIMDPVSSGNGIHEEIATTDLRMLEVIGYDIDYAPQYASVMILHDSDTLDLNKLTDTLKVLNVPLNGSKSTSIELVNLDLNNTLNYEAEVFVDIATPEDASYNIGVDVIEGSISSGHSSSVVFSATGSNTPAVFFGTLRFHTNDENKLVIDIPFKVSTDGAIEPTIAADQMDLGSFTFDSKSLDKVKSKELTIKNLGNIELNYRLLLSLMDKSNYPYAAKLAKSKNGNPCNILSQFYNAELLDSTELLFNADFETGFDDFTPTGTNSEDWHRIATGPALLEGHSQTTAAHFGIDYTDSIRYRSYSDASLISKSFDFSSISPQDLITLSFNYYLQAEVGYDFASVLVSYDNGSTYEEIATSDGGIIANDTIWQSVVIQLPYLSGNSNPVKFAFKFTSDQLLNYEGWFIDDIQISVIKNANSIYTNVKTGSLPGLNDEEKINLTVNADKFEVGYYKGYLSIHSNDPFNSELAIPFYIKNLLIEPAGKNIIYASTGRGTNAKGKLLTINKVTGVGTEIGSSGFEPLKSITVFPESGEIYGLNTSAFIPSSVVRVNAKDGYGFFQFESVKKLSAILFDLNNNFYAASDDKMLYKLDPVSGDTTFIGDIGFKVAAMTIDTKTGDIIASVDATSNKDKLYRINVTNADTTYLGKTGLAKITRGLVFDENGNLFGVVGEDSQLSTFISIDVNTGTAIQIGDVGFKGVAGLTMVPDSTTAVEENKNGLPKVFSLKQNYPNPFNPNTNIEYSIPEAGFVVMKIFDVLGKEVTTLVNSSKSAGIHITKWNAGSYASGIYIYQLEYNAPNNIRTTLRKKMILTK